MNLALLTDADVFAGTEKHLLDLAEALTRTEPEISLALICPDPSPLAERAHAANLPIVAIPPSKIGMFNFETLRILRRHLRSERFQLLHAHNGRTALHATLACMLAGRGQVIFTQHFLAPSHISLHGWKARLYRFVHLQVNKRITQFIAVSDAARQGMLMRQDTPAERVTTVHNALRDPDKKALAAPEATRAAFGLQPDMPLVVCLARLEKEKSLDTLIAAMALLRERNVAAQCVIAGEGEMRHEIERQIDRLDLRDCVLLPGYCEDALSLLNLGDLLVLCSEFESFGLVLLEAMTLSKPVVATRCGGASEIVEDGDTGILVPLRDTEALAGALEKLLINPALRHEMGIKGRERYEAHFQPERMARETIAVYQRAQKSKC